MSKIIVDCDTGNDDAWAIISLLRAEQILDFKVKAITCVNGNTTVDHSSMNTLLVLKTLNRLDIPVIFQIHTQKILKFIFKFQGIFGCPIKFDKK